MYYNKNDPVFDKTFIIFQNIIFKIMGLSPWTLNVLKMYRENSSFDVLNYECQFSLVGCLYNVLLMIIIVLSIAYTKINEESISIQDNIVSKQVLMIISYVIALLTCGILLVYIINGKVMINVLNRLKSIDEKLRNCAAYKFQSNMSIFVIFVINFFLCACFNLIVFCNNFTLQEFLFEMPFVINSYIIMQFTMLLDAIYKRFEMINFAISNLDVIKKVSSVPDRLCATNSSPSHQLIIYEIGSIKCAYKELCEICLEINNFYGLIMVFIILITGTISVIILYFEFFALSGEIEFNIYNVTDAIWLLWIAYDFVVLTVFVSSTEQEV